MVGVLPASLYDLFALSVVIVAVTVHGEVYLLGEGLGSGLMKVTGFLSNCLWYQDVSQHPRQYSKSWVEKTT